MECLAVSSEVNILAEHCRAELAGKTHPQMSPLVGRQGTAAVEGIHADVADVEPAVQVSRLNMYFQAALG